MNTLWKRAGFYYACEKYFKISQLRENLASKAITLCFMWEEKGGGLNYEGTKTQPALASLIFFDSIKHS